MANQRYFVMTGVTSGLGLEAAKHLAADSPRNMIIAGARSTEKAVALQKAIPQNQLRILQLDTSSLASVGTFCKNLKDSIGAHKISGMALNAGIQITDGDRFSVDGFELTFATNVLGHAVLHQLLRDILDPSAVILSTASGTHDKDHKLAKPYGFRGGTFPSANQVALGNVSEASDPAQIGRDRYSTSKLCNILFTYAMARDCRENEPRYIAYDPGLMPGTGLARTQPRIIQFAWKFILPLVGYFIDGASTAGKSGKMLSQLILGEKHPVGTGLHIEFTGKEIQSSDLSYEQQPREELMDWINTAIRRNKALISG